MNEVVQGDCLEVLAGMPEGSVDLIYADPPFATGRNFGQFDDRWADGLDGLDGFLEYMRPRLTECRRVLKDTGSLYLHCDTHASHYLKIMLDTIFGRKMFRNEIVWKRTTGRSDGGQYGRVHDIILFYAGEGRVWNRPFLPHDPEYVKRAYRHQDERGQWRAGDLTAAGTSGGISGQPWRGIDPGKNGNHWRTPTQGGMNDFLKEYIPGWPDDYPTTIDRLDVLDEHGFIYWPKKEGGMPRLKRYLASTQGTAIGDIFTDIGKLEAQAKEKVGYPTQKPLALLERIIRASSNEGDLILDPFCGSGTALVAAKMLGRNYLGIDLSAEAVTIAEERLAADSCVNQREMEFV